MVKQFGRLSFALCLLCAVCGVLAPHVHAQVPHLVRYQGQAMDSKQVPLEGPYTLTFRLYNAETVGTKIWEETQTSVSLQGGHFSILLGAVTPLGVDWSVPLWLSIQVGVEPELSPRQRITSVPLAVRAEVAESLAGGPTDISVRAYNSADISIPNNTNVALPLDSERWDTAAMHDVTVNNDRLIVNTAGKYLVVAHVAFAPNAAGYRFVRIRGPGGLDLAAARAPGLGDDSNFFSLATYYNFNVGDFVQILVQQTSGGALSVQQSGHKDAIELGMVKVQ